MAYRKVDINFWTDVELEDYSPEQKYFYLYLITNPFSNQIGLYEFSINHAILHTGLSRKEVLSLLDFFEAEDKIVRSGSTKEILVVKFWHHNKSNSPKLRKHCEDLYAKVKDKSLIDKTYGRDPVLFEVEAKPKEPKKKEVRNIVYPYDSKEFKEMWANWLEYKREEFNFKYKSVRSEQASLTQLSKISDNAEEAIEIIMTSMSNGWKGFFKKKNNDRQTDSASDIAVGILEKRGFRK